MNFTSGITKQNKYIISLEDYHEEDIPWAWNMSKRYHNLDENARIDFNDYDENWLTVEWEGNVFFPTFHNVKVKDSKLVRVFNIKNI